MVFKALHQVIDFLAPLASDLVALLIGVWLVATAVTVVVFRYCHATR